MLRLSRAELNDLNVINTIGAADRLQAQGVPVTVENLMQDLGRSSQTVFIVFLDTHPALWDHLGLERPPIPGVTIFH